MNDWGIVIGVMEVYGYEKIEVICGVNGLFIGVGNVLGMFNYVCKCFKNENGGEIGVFVGLWDFKCL